MTGKGLLELRAKDPRFPLRPPPSAEGGHGGAMLRMDSRRP